MADKSVEIHHDHGMRLVARTGTGHEIVMDDGNGDTGARPYLLAHGVLPVECGDLTTGVDVDLGPS